MAVDRVEAGVADAADEPPAINARRRIEHGFGLFDPVDGGRRLAPKTLRVALPARVDLVIAARTGVHADGLSGLYPGMVTAGILTVCPALASLSERCDRSARGSMAR